MLKLPNAYILQGEDPENSFMVYGELNKSGSVAKGWRLNVPNLSHATAAQKNELRRNLQTYLSRFDQNKRVQFSSGLTRIPTTMKFSTAMNRTPKNMP